MLIGDGEVSSAAGPDVDNTVEPLIKGESNLMLHSSTAERPRAPSAEKLGAGEARKFPPAPFANGLGAGDAQEIPPADLGAGDAYGRIDFTYDDKKIANDIKFIRLPIKAGWRQNYKRMTTAWFVKNRG